MEVALRVGQQLGSDAPHVVEGLAADEPGDGREAAPVDRAVERLTGLDVQHVDLGLLGPADGELVGEAVALLRGLPAVERGEARRIEDHRVDEDALDAGGVDDVQDGELLARLAPGDETALAPPVGGRYRARPEQALDLLREGIAGGPGIALSPGEVPLSRRPFSRARVVGGLKPSIRVRDGGAVEHVDVVGAVRVGVAGASGCVWRLGCVVFGHPPTIR
ncbi:unannotated protein [freshwater metagenome]|uniref:Unannotated protein n=1 Tax=freshwater metagenome TaxID=449393 RepID=A0A6J7LVI3_9ZZZZ